MSKTRHILVVEDDEAVRMGIEDALVFEGYSVQVAVDGSEGLECALHSQWDLMLLDLMLPGLDGLSILKQVRSVHSAAPIIILSALGEENSRVQGLRGGADDYVVKPFSVQELLARVAAVLRRSPERPQEVDGFEIATGTVDLMRCEVRFNDGERTDLSQREVDLLRYLARNPGRVVARDELLTRIWRVNPDRVETRTIDMHVARLRDKLRDDKKKPAILLTVRGKGYLLSESKGAIGLEADG